MLCESFLHPLMKCSISEMRWVSRLEWLTVHSLETSCKGLVISRVHDLFFIYDFEGKMMTLSPEVKRSHEYLLRIPASNAVGSNPRLPSRASSWQRWLRLDILRELQRICPSYTWFSLPFESLTDKSLPKCYSPASERLLWKESWCLQSPVACLVHHIDRNLRTCLVHLLNGVYSTSSLNLETVLFMEE